MIHQLTPWAASAAFVLMATLAIYVWCWREKLNEALEEEDATDRLADALIAKYEEERRRNTKERQKRQEEDRIKDVRLYEEKKLRDERFKKILEKIHDVPPQGARVGLPLTSLNSRKEDLVHPIVREIPPSTSGAQFVYNVPTLGKCKIERLDVIFDPKMPMSVAAGVVKGVKIWGENTATCTLFLPKIPLLLFKTEAPTHLYWEFKNAPVFAPHILILIEASFDVYAKVPYEMQIVLRGEIQKHLL